MLFRSYGGVGGVFSLLSSLFCGELIFSPLFFFVCVP